MKEKSIAAIAAIAALAGCATSSPTASSPTASSPAAFAPCVQSPASLEKLSWTFVTGENGVVDAETTPPDGLHDLSYAFCCGWNEKELQVVVLTIDDDISTDSCKSGAISCPAWDDDAVEVFLDGAYARLPDSRADGGVHLKHGGEFALVANGAANSDYSGYPNSFARDGAANALWSGRVEQFDADCPLRGWLLAQPECPVGFWPEGSHATCYGFVFSWAAMGLENRPGRIGFNIGVQDDDGGGRRDHALYWTGDPQRPYANESAFGTLVLE